MKELIEDSLSRLIKRGGIYYGVSGGSLEEVMSNIIGNLPADLLPSRKNEALLQAVMEREALISTGIENGVALPHPRTPMLEDGEDPFVAIAFPLNPLDWGTPDGSKVHTVFLIVSKSPKQHLAAFSKITFLCQQKEFFSLLSARAPNKKIIAAIGKAEKDWGADG